MNAIRSKIPANNKKKAGGSDPSSGAEPTARPPRTSHRNRVLCRTSEYKPPGSSIVGLSKDNQPAKLVWELQYGLNEKQFKELSARFPGVAFVQTGMDCHDHPIAHTSYRIVWENVMSKLHPGWRVADVSGNPQHNEQFNKRQAGRDKPITVDTFCKVVSTKDSVRAKTRWGPPEVDGKQRWEELTLYDMYRNEENRQRFAQYDAFLMNHVLYYYTKSEVTRLLNLNKNAVLLATIHKLPGKEGSINCGEQAYEKDLVTGAVRQWNVETGEDYRHPDPAPWFRDFSYADEHGAIAWTINKGCDDTYVVTVTATEPCLVPEECWLGRRIILTSNEGETIAVGPVEIEDPPPAYPVEVVKIKTRDILPNSFVEKEINVNITHPELFETLKAFMINKPRNHVTLKDLTHKAHREVGNNTLRGNNVKIKIDSRALTEHIFAAWTHGVQVEDALFGVVTSQMSVSSVNRNLAGKTMHLGSANAAQTFIKYALSASAIARSKDPVHQVLLHVDELL